jgi:hypothetical protein
MNKAERIVNPVHSTLGVMLLHFAINASGGRYCWIIPAAWLEGSIFHNSFILSLIFFIYVGGSVLIAAITVLNRHHTIHKAAYICI